MARDGFATAAYGLHIEGLGHPEMLRIDGSPSWPPVAVSQQIGESTGVSSGVDDRRAVFQLPDTELIIERERREALFTTTRPFSIDELAHPYLAPVGNVFARWDGHETLHAGAFAAEGGAWVLLGDKGAGKSTTLAWLARQGHEVLADDVVVLHGGSALSGPRCIDVRDDASSHLSAGRPASLPREGGRNRLPLPPIVPEFPLRGFVYLEWDERVTVERIKPAERIARLQPHRQVVRLHNDPVAQLDLAALPAFVLRRPPGLEGLDRSGEALLAALD